MKITGVFIYNARISDEIKVNDKVIKRRNDDPKGLVRNLNHLQINFLEDFEQAVTLGMEERIDSVFLNADNYRGNEDAPQIFPVLGCRRIKIEIK